MFVFGTLNPTRWVEHQSRHKQLYKKQTKNAKGSDTYGRVEHKEGDTVLTMHMSTILLYNYNVNSEKHPTKSDSAVTTWLKSPQEQIIKKLQRPKYCQSMSLLGVLHDSF